MFVPENNSVPATPPYIQVWQNGVPVQVNIIWVWVRAWKWIPSWRMGVMALSHKRPIVQLERPAPAGERLVVMYETNGG